MNTMATPLRQIALLWATLKSTQCAFIVTPYNKPIGILRYNSTGMSVIEVTLKGYSFIAEIRLKQDPQPVKEENNDKPSEVYQSPELPQS